jgi:uncharacterized protein
MQIQHDVLSNGGIFFLEKQQYKLAEITYMWKNEDIIVANHTWVDDSLRGQGVARELLDALVNFTRQNKLKIVPMCSYVEVMFRRDKSFVDVIA